MANRSASTGWAGPSTPTTNAARPDREAYAKLGDGDPAG
jgi:hypothetical protein